MSVEKNQERERIGEIVYVCCVCRLCEIWHVSINHIVSYLSLSFIRTPRSGAGGGAPRRDWRRLKLPTDGNNTCWFQVCSIPGKWPVGIYIQWDIMGTKHIPHNGANEVIGWDQHAKWMVPGIRMMWMSHFFEVGTLVQVYIQYILYIICTSICIIIYIYIIMLYSYLQLPWISPHDTGKTNNPLDGRNKMWFLETWKHHFIPWCTIMFTFKMVTLGYQPFWGLPIYIYTQHRYPPFCWLNPYQDMFNIWLVQLFL